MTGNEFTKTTNKKLNKTVIILIVAVVVIFIGIMAVCLGGVGVTTVVLLTKGESSTEYTEVDLELLAFGTEDFVFDVLGTDYEMNVYEHDDYNSYYYNFADEYSYYGEIGSLQISSRDHKRITTLTFSSKSDKLDSERLKKIVAMYDANYGPHTASEGKYEWDLEWYNYIRVSYDAKGIDIKYFLPND